MIANLTGALLLSVLVFGIGMMITLVKKNAIFVLIGIELMLNAANLNLVAASANDPSHDGQIMAIFSIVLAAAEVATALAILLNVYKHFKSTDLDQLKRLKY